MRVRTTRNDYGSGIAASLGAEVVFMAIMMGLSKAQGKDPWHITRAPASLVMGPAATHPPGFYAPDVTRGLAMHAILSVLVGAAYVELLKRSNLSPVAGGVITGEVLYTLGTYILPNVFPRWLSPMAKSKKERVVAAGTHALYGITFGLFYQALRPVK